MIVARNWILKADILGRIIFKWWQKTQHAKLVRFIDGFILSVFRLLNQLPAEPTPDMSKVSWAICQQVSTGGCHNFRLQLVLRQLWQACVFVSLWDRVHESRKLGTSKVLGSDLGWGRSASKAWSVCPVGLVCVSQEAWSTWASKKESSHFGAINIYNYSNGHENARGFCLHLVIFIHCFCSLEQLLVCRKAHEP